MSNELPSIIFQKLESADDFERLSVIQDLWKYNDRRIPNIVLSLLHDKNFEIRKNAYDLYKKIILQSCIINNTFSASFNEKVQTHYVFARKIFDEAIFLLKKNISKVYSYHFLISIPKVILALIMIYINAFIDDPQKLEDYKFLLTLMLIFTHLMLKPITWLYVGRAIYSNFEDKIYKATFNLPIKRQDFWFTFSISLLDSIVLLILYTPFFDNSQINFMKFINHTLIYLLWYYVSFFAFPIAIVPFYTFKVKDYLIRICKEFLDKMILVLITIVTTIQISFVLFLVLFMNFYYILCIEVFTTNLRFLLSKYTLTLIGLLYFCYIILEPIWMSIKIFISSLNYKKN